MKMGVRWVVMSVDYRHLKRTKGMGKSRVKTFKNSNSGTDIEGKYLVGFDVGCDVGREVGRLWTLQRTKETGVKRVKTDKNNNREQT